MHGAGHFAPDPATSRFTSVTARYTWDPMDSDDPPRDDATRALAALRQLVQGLRTSAHAVERDLGLSGAQMFVLGEIAAEPGASIKRLSERTLTDPSSVSVVVARLVDAGFITRERDPNDGRKTILGLTSRGTKLLAKAPEAYQTRLIAALRSMSPTRLKHLNAALTELATTLDATAAPLFFEEPPRGRRRGN